MRKLWVIFLLGVIAVPVMASNVRKEKVTLSTGRVIEGYLLDVTEDYIRMYVDGDLMKLRLRNMDIRSADYFRKYDGPRDLIVPLDVLGLDKAGEAEEADSPKPKTVKDFVMQGMDFMDQGEFLKAADAFSEAIALDPDVGDLYLYRIGAYQEAGEFEKAVEDIGWLMKRSPGDMSLYARRGWLYQLAGKADLAIADYSRAIEADPQNLELLLDRFNIYSAVQNWDLALKDMETILEINPAYGEGYLDRAFIYFDLNDFNAAWENVHKTLQNGVRVPSKFIDALKKKMPDPIMAERNEKKKQETIAKVRLFFEENLIFIVIVIVLVLAGIVFMILPSKPVEPRLSAVRKEQEDVEVRAFFRPVDLRKAANGRRFCAGMIDLIVFGLISWGVDILVKPPVFSLVMAMLLLAKDSAFGVSIGKILLGLRVVDEHGYRSTVFQGFLRNFTLGLPVVIFWVIFWSQKFIVGNQVRIYLLALWGIFLLESLLIVLSRKYGRRIGDYLAGTYVHDDNPQRKSWPCWILSVVLSAVFLLGMIAMNMIYHKAFLYKLNPLRYYDVKRDFSFKVPKGWIITGEGEGGIVLEKKEHSSSMILIINEDVSSYPLELCVDAFTQAMKSGGMEMRARENITVSSRQGVKVGFMEKETDSAYLLIYFKEEEKGPLYILQGTTPRQYMRYVMADSMDFITSFRFE